MKGLAPLLVEWTPSCVRVVDPVSGTERMGATLMECAPPAGRDAVIAIGRRSAFVRTAFVPAGSAAAVEGVLAFQLGQSLPLPPNEAVFGYRMGEHVPGKGRRTAVGAMRSESLVRLYADAQATGLRVQAVLPVAFGSWLAARANDLRDVAVVGFDDGILSIDLVRDGELAYSRAVPLVDVEDAPDEIERTFTIADSPTLPTLAVASPALPADRHETRESLAFLGDLPSIDRLLFSLEPPAKREARLRRRERWKAQRALLTTLVAVALVAYGVGARARVKVASKPTGVAIATAQAKKARSQAQERFDRAERANRVLNVAFRPSQNLTDVVRALSAAAGDQAWFTSLTVGRGIPITLTGFALHGAGVSKCLDAASSDPRFREMHLVSTTKSMVGTTPVTQFALTGNSVGMLPYDRPIKKEKKAVAKPKRTDR